MNFSNIIIFPEKQKTTNVFKNLHNAKIVLIIICKKHNKLLHVFELDATGFQLPGSSGPAGAPGRGSGSARPSCRRRRRGSRRAPDWYQPDLLDRKQAEAKATEVEKDKYVSYKISTNSSYFQPSDIPQ